MQIAGRDVGTLLKRTGKEIGEDKVPLFAAQMAYNFFFSLFPLVLFMAAVLSVVASREQVIGWVGNIGAALPRDVASLLVKTLTTIVDAKGSAGLLSFGLLTALWSGSAIFGAFMQALNAAYDVTETRPWWKRQAIRIAMLVVSALVLLVATVVMLNGEGVVQWLGDALGLGETTRTVWTVVQFPLVFAALVALLFLQYWFLPDCRHRDKRSVLVAAVIAAVLWLLATLLFRLYVQKFHVMNPAYGAIGAIMVLLTWMYYSSFVLLAAGELSSELEKGTAAAPASAAGRADSRAAAHVERGRDARLPAPASDAPGLAAAALRARDEAIGDNAISRAAARAAARADARAAFARAGVTGPGDAPQGLTNGESRGLGTLIRELADGGVLLVRRELELARLEIADILRGVTLGTAQVAFGGVMALLGMLSLFTGISLLPGDQWFRDQYWAAALLVTLVAGAVAFGFLRKGMTLLSPARLRPAQTIETLEEDLQWLKHQKERMRSDTTSH